MKIYIVSSATHGDNYGAYSSLGGAVGFIGELMGMHNTTGVEIVPSGVYENEWYATFNDTGETFKIEEMEVDA